MRSRSFWIIPIALLANCGAATVASGLAPASVPSEDDGELFTYVDPRSPEKGFMLSLDNARLLALRTWQKEQACTVAIADAERERDIAIYREKKAESSSAKTGSFWTGFGIGAGVGSAAITLVAVLVSSIHR